MQLTLPFQLVIIGVLIIFVGSSVFASVYIFTSPDADPLENGLVGYWPFNGNANDATSYGNNGTTNNVTLTTDRFGNANSAYQFNGASNSNVSLPNPTPNFISANNAPFSFSMWARPSTVTGPNSKITLSNESYLNSGFRYGITAGTNMAFWTNESGGNLNPSNFQDSVFLTANNWYNFIVTYDGSVFKMFTNGTQTAFSPSSSTIKSNTNNVVVGGGAGGVSYFAGVIDDVRFYNRALTPSDVNLIYTNASGPTSNSNTLNLNAGAKQLVGQWEFDATIDDNTPYANNASVTGATMTTDRKGRANSAAAFNGSNQYMSVADTSVLQFGTGDYSVSAWVKPTGATDKTAVAKYAGSSSSNFYLGLTSSGAASFSTGSSTPLTGGSGLNNNAWHLITGVRVGGVGYLYVDGQQVATGAMTGNASASGSYVGIGKFGSSGTSYFNGSIDDVRLYKRGITAQEVADLYATYDADFSVSDLQKLQVGRWRFDGGATDTTPYSNNGTWAGSGPFSLTVDRLNRANMAYSFGGNRYLIIPDPPQFIPSNSAPFSISLWVKPSTLAATTDVRALMTNESYNNHGFRLGIDANTGDISFWSVESGGTVAYSTSSGVTTSSWSNIVVVYNGTTATTYINGQAVGSGNGTVRAGSAQLQIGEIGGKNKFSGLMDDVRIWNRALTTAEVSQLYVTY